MSLAETQKLKTILKKHVNTIHCSNNLTLVQRKLFNALLFNAYNDLLQKGQYEISIKRLCQLIGYDSRDYKKLRRSLLELITTAIEWNVIGIENGEEKDRWRASSIIASAKIENGICTYEFSSIMRELLHTPEIYGKIDLQLMIEFKSSYGLALYENCIRFQGLASTQWLSLSVFRKLMGIPDGKYINFCDFKKRVLDIAVKEVNQHSPMNVMPEIQRVNKKVMCIRFKISNKVLRNLNIAMSSADLEDKLGHSLRQEFGLSAEAINDLSLKYDFSYIQSKMELIKRSESFKTGKIREMAAYLMDALKRDYQLSKSSHRLIVEKKSEREQLASQEKKREDHKIKTENERMRKKVAHYVQQMSASNYNNLLIKFEKFIKEKDSFYLFKKYKAMGLKSPAVKAMFNSFVSQLMNENPSQTFACCSANK